MALDAIAVQLEGKIGQIEMQAGKWLPGQGTREESEASQREVTHILTINISICSVLFVRIKYHLKSPCFPPLALSIHPHSKYFFFLTFCFDPLITWAGKTFAPIRLVPLLPELRLWPRGRYLIRTEEHWTCLLEFTKSTCGRAQTVVYTGDVSRCNLFVFSFLDLCFYLILLSV